MNFYLPKSKPLALSYSFMQTPQEQRDDYARLTPEQKTKWRRAVELSTRVKQLRALKGGISRTPKKFREQRWNDWEEEETNAMQELRKLVNDLPILKQYL